jgi:predicted transcriptional regulator
MTTLSARRYAPNKSADLQAPILAALTDQWCNVAAIAEKLHRPSDDSAIRYCVRMLAEAGMIERTSAQGPRGTVYFYRRKA